MAQLTKHEAQQAMREGKKVAHDLFTADEWIASNPGGTEITDENGYKISAEEYWADRTELYWYDDWRIIG